MMGETKLQLTIWFLAFYLIGQVKTSISSLQLSWQLGLAYNTAWMLNSEIVDAMSERDETCVLEGKVQIDDAYLGGELPGGKSGRGSENKVPIVAAISLNSAGNPIHAKISRVAGFTSEAHAGWARQHLSSSCSVLSDGLACFRSVVAAGCSHTAVVTGGHHPNNLPQCIRSGSGMRRRSRMQIKPLH